EDEVGVDVEDVDVDEVDVVGPDVDDELAELVRRHALGVVRPRRRVLDLLDPDAARVRAGRCRSPHHEAEEETDPAGVLHAPTYNAAGRRSAPGPAGCEVAYVRPSGTGVCSRSTLTRASVEEKEEPTMSSLANVRPLTLEGRIVMLEPMEERHAAALFEI